MIAGFAPLLADAELLKVIGFIIVALIYAFNYFVGAKGQQRKPPRPEMRPRPPGAPAGRQEVSDEVAEFLRRTAERTGGKKPAQPEVAQPQRRPLSERRLKSLPASASTADTETVEVVAVDEPAPADSIAAHVQQFDTRILGERSGQPTQAEQESRLLQSHVQQTFDHQLGRLAQRTPDAPTAGESPAPISAESIAELLANPENVRGAVVLNEILQRPTDRW